MNQVSRPNILGSAASGLGTVASTFATQFIGPVFAGVMFVAGIAGFLFFSIRMVWEHVGRPSGTFPRMLLYSASALAAFVVLWAGWSVHSQLTAPPKLRIRLVPERIEGKRLDFHLSVENSGPRDINVERYKFEVPGDFEIDQHRQEQRTVHAQDEISLPIYSANQFIRVGIGNLVLQYRMEDGTVRHTTCTFRLPKDIGLPIVPTCGDEADAAQWLSLCEFVESKFSQVAGGVGLGFAEAEDGRPFNISCSRNGRTLIVDSTHRFVQFATPHDGELRTYRGDFAIMPDGHHNFIIGWSDEREGMTGGEVDNLVNMKWVSNDR